MCFSLAVQAGREDSSGRRVLPSHRVGGQSRRYLGRLNTRTGTLDTAFDLRGEFPTLVAPLAVQADGKILVGGYFSSLAGQPRDRIGRNSNGTPDTAPFNPGANDPGCVPWRCRRTGRFW